MATRWRQAALTCTLLGLTASSLLWRREVSAAVPVPGFAPDADEPRVADDGAFAQDGKGDLSAAEPAGVPELVSAAARASPSIAARNATSRRDAALPKRSRPRAPRPTENVPDHSPYAPRRPADMSYDGRNGSVIFLWHTIKTGGTTLRSIFQRQAQLAGASFYYVTHFDSPMWHALLWQLLSAPPRARRTLVEMHNPWGLHAQAVREVAHVRERYRGVCPVLLVTFVRRPVPLMISLYNWRVFDFTPFCQWLPVANLQLRMLLGLAAANVNHPAAREPTALTQRDLDGVLGVFDFVGVLERFDESLAVLGRLGGLRGLTYVARNANTRETAITRCSRRAVKLLEAGAGARAEAVRELRELSRLGGEYLRTKPARRRTPANCRWWGCREQMARAGGVFQPAMCAAVPDSELSAPLLEMQSLDAQLHERAVRALDARLAALGEAALAAELEQLRHAKAALLEAELKSDRRHAHSSTCVRCGTTPKNQLDGCWPDWLFFEPEESCFTCTRTWHHAPRAPNPAYKGDFEHVPCYQDCWEPTEPLRAALRRPANASGRTPAADGGSPGARPRAGGRRDWLSACTRALAPAEVGELRRAGGRRCSPACGATPVRYGRAVSQLLRQSEEARAALLGDD